MTLTRKSFAKNRIDGMASPSFNAPLIIAALSCADICS
jgi:hypothetical protein